MEFARAFITVSRYVLPFVAVLLTAFCTLDLLLFKKRRLKAELILDDMQRFEINGTQTLIGSGSRCDLRIPGMAEEHAVLSYSASGFCVCPLPGCSLSVSGRSVRKSTPIGSYDEVSLGDRKFTVRQSGVPSQKGKKNFSSGLFGSLSLFLLNLYEMLMALSFILTDSAKAFPAVLCFGAVGITGMVLLAVRKFRNDPSLSVIFLFLCTNGLAVALQNSVSDAYKQLLCMAVGLAAAILIKRVLLSQKAIPALRMAAFVGGIGLLMVNAVFGKVYNGSQNWIHIGPFSLQLSEFVKIALVFLSMASLNEIARKRNAVGFLAFSLLSVAALAYFRDFGTALIYGAVCLTVLVLRLADMKWIFGGLLATAAAGGVVLLTVPYVAKRFFAFGHAFENAATTGFQQTRTMIAVASGGLFGQGTGGGNLGRVSAADTDLVFGLLCEQWGLLVGLCVAALFAVLALYALRCLRECRDVSFGIGACAAAAVFLSQAALNIFGSLDLLPFTGVTLPFISNGGSSMIACVALTGFFRAAAESRVRGGIFGEEQG